MTEFYILNDKGDKGILKAKFLAEALTRQTMWDRGILKYSKFSWSDKEIVALSIKHCDLLQFIKEA